MVQRVRTAHKRQRRRLLFSELLESRFAMDGSCGNVATQAHLEITPPISYFVAAGTPAPATPSTSGVALASIPVSTQPAYSSLPGAADTLYLDFNGHFEPTWGSYSNVTTPAYSIDSDFANFSDQEQANIQAIWAQVAEDYAPFNINVTTVEPTSFANGVGMRVAIGGSSYDWLGSGAGGVGYVNAYTNSIVNTVYVFPAQLANGTAKYVGEASSHEAGHGYGLQHQSQYDAAGNLLADYYAGANGKAPIMGNSYSATRGLWWNGTSTSATTIQDDMSVISRSTNTFGYRADEAGNTATTATPITVSGTQISGKGVIAQTTDVDVYSFSTSPGTISLAVAVGANNNLDSVIELQNATGTVLASAAPTTSFGASLTYNVTAAGSYRLAVKSAGSYGDVGQYTVSGTIIPINTVTIAAPTNLVATKSVGSVGLTWTDNAGNETSYTVQRSTDGGATFATLATLAADAVSYTDAAVAAGGSYVYRVFASASGFDSPLSNTATATYAPTAPAGLTATASSSTAISLSWGNVAGETGFKIYRSIDSITFTQIGTAGANVLTYSSSGLSTGTTYYYLVVANNAGGDSGISNIASATTFVVVTKPTSPSSLTVTGSTATSVSLRWTDRSNNETGFYVERRRGNNGNYTRIATLAANATTYVDTTVAANTTYSYRVRAYNAAGTSSASNTVTVRTPVAGTTPAAISNSGQVAAAGNSGSTSTTTGTNNGSANRSCGDDAIESVFRSVGERDDFWASIFG